MALKTCKVKSDYKNCFDCMTIQEMYGNGVVIDCHKCKATNDTYELLLIGTSFWSGDYAMVQKDGVIQKVSLSRVYDVKEGRIIVSVH